MQKIILMVGIPGSGKSTWAKTKIAADPDNWCRINNDDIRAMMNDSVWSKEYEGLITETRNFMIREALKRGKNVIIDNLNLNKRHFDEAVKIAKSVNGDYQIMEQPFFVELEVAIARDAARAGKAKVGESVIKKWWKDSGGKQFQYYKPRMENVKTHCDGSATAESPAWIDGLPEAVLCDLDGTLALMNGRSPYDASTCDQDLPNHPVIKTLLAHYAQGRKVIFCSGREDKYKDATIRFIEKYVKAVKMVGQFDGKDYPEEAVISYELYMRKTGDMRKDAIIKEEIYNEHIKDKVNVLLVLDDRNQVVDFWRSKGLVCFQVAPGAF